MIATGLALSTTACGASLHPFAMRSPLGRDSDLAAVSVACHREPDPKDPKHVSCAPEVYVSPLAWDAADNSLFRPLSEVFAIPAVGEAPNANSLDEVPDSAWFTNRLGRGDMRLDEMVRGACEPDQLLEGEAAGDGTWVVDQGKANGSSPGFRVRIPGKGKYMLKADSPKGERPTASSAIGAAFYNAVGFFTSCEQVIFVKPSVLKLTPGLTVTDNTQMTTAFDQAALQGLLDRATHKGEYIRFQASAWLPGHLIGPFRYEKTRSDDPNDIIPHEDRRELRGGRLLAAWLDHFDAREQNSMDSWIAQNPKGPPDGSPGYVRHYYLDMSDTIGSEWDWDSISRRLGHSYLVDWGYIAADFVTLGIPQRPWDRAQHTPGMEDFGYFSTRDFVPEKWVNEYPNPAFSRMTERDGAWMARILARFTPEMIEKVAAIGKFVDSAKTAYVSRILEGRLEIILQRYLTRLSPMSDVRVEDGSRLCGTDLASVRGLRPAAAFTYGAQMVVGTAKESTALPVSVAGSATFCIPLPHVVGDGSDAYVRVRIVDGVAAGPLVAHLYDLGPSRGYRLAGLERPSP